MPQVRNLDLHKENESIKEGIRECNMKTFVFLILLGVECIPEFGEPGLAV